MTPKVLVIGDSPALRDLVDLMLFGRANVVWHRTPNETEGLGTSAVVLDDYGRENLSQLRVHPQLADVPVIWVGGTDPQAADGVRIVDAPGTEGMRQLSDHLGEVMGRLFQHSVHHHSRRRIAAA